MDIMDKQTMQFILIIAIILLIVVTTCAFRWHSKLETANSDNEKLKASNKKLQLTVSEKIDSQNAESNKKSKKNKKSKANLEPIQDINALNEKIQSQNEKIQAQKSEISKLKEKNYSLEQDNKSLRKDIIENNQSNNDDQKEIVTLRESNNDLTSELQAAKKQLADLEKQIADNKAETPAPQPASSNPEDAQKIESLEKENASLNASVKDLCAELATFKRDFKNEVDNAKKEVADSNRDLKKSLVIAQRQIQQSKKRADNNHQLYLIARAQMLLAEKRLLIHEPNYKSPVPLPTSNEAIAETIKKIVTFDARESRASHDLVKLNEKVKALESENNTLKNSMANEKAISFGDFDDDDDSLNSLVNDLASQHINPSEAPTVIGIANNSSEKRSISGITSGLASDDLGSMDLSKIDDDWESI